MYTQVGKIPIVKGEYGISGSDMFIGTVILTAKG